MSDLTVPDVTGLPAREAALAYAAAGWYVGPLRHRDKHPGGVLSGDWDRQTSRDPAIIAEWFPDGTRRGVFLHVGRSGALVFDIDAPENLHPLVRRAAEESDPPWQATRPATPDRRHLVFAQPEGRDLGNSLGGLKGGWGEVRGRNGVIVVAPSEHEDPSGRYAWGRAGRVPTLPAYCADLLPDRLAGADRATQAEVAAFLSDHAAGGRLDALALHVSAWEAKVDAGESRHDSLVGHLAGAMKEAAAGLYPAEAAAEAFEGRFLEAVAGPGVGRQGAARSAGEAREEWREALGWAVAQARAADPDETRARTAERAPGPGDDFAPVPGDAPPPPTGAPTPLAVRLRRKVEATHEVFPAAGDGRVFVRPRAGGRAELLTGGLVIRAGGGVGSQAGTLSAAAAEAAKVLAAHAEVRPPRALSLRAHSRPGRVVLDLAQPGNSRCAVATADGWTVEDVPPEDVTFQSAGLPLPDPERGGDVDELRALLGWSRADPRWLLVKGWLPCSLLADVPRPMLGLFGPQGSAKSTTGRFVVDLVDPKPSGALGGGFGKNRADDETKAFGSYLVAWDNVSKVSEEAADLLSRLVTGDMIEKRRLYTDADVATITYRRTGVLTGISIPRGVKADTLDRLILLHLRPLAERASERSLEAGWAAARPRVLAGVLDLAARMLAGERANPDRLRMADYAESLWAVDPDLYRAYAANVREARSEMAEDDPFVATLLRWLRSEPGQDWEGTATDARQAAGWHRPPESQWWPGNGKAFMDAITANLELLREAGVAVGERKVRGVRLKRFTVDDAALL